MSPYGDVQDEVEWMIEGPVPLIGVRISKALVLESEVVVVVHETFDLRRRPLNRVDVELGTCRGSLVCAPLCVLSV